MCAHLESGMTGINNFSGKNSLRAILVELKKIDIIQKKHFWVAK